MDISEIIKDLNSQIKAKFPDFRGSYLYGSYAKGTYTEDSDVDIILIFNSPPSRDEKMGIYSILCDLDYKYNMVIMGLPYTKNDLEQNYVFHDEVVNKGVYYDAA